MEDPGAPYLYRSPEKKAKDRQADKTPPTLVMNPLARDPTHIPSSSTDWGKCLGNMESAKLALDTLKNLVQDAVFLDEDAYTNAHTMQLYQQRIQVSPWSSSSSSIKE
jgi:hypothetical protein